MIRQPGDVRIRGGDFLHATRRKAMAGDVDDVVGSPHDVRISVLVDEPGVGGFVIAREFLESAPGDRRGA